MDVVGGFEDMLRLLEKHKARYLIVGGVAFVYHVKPRFTKGLDLWVDPSGDNPERVNRALAEFGAPIPLAPGDRNRILQIGVAPDRIDLIQEIKGVRFGSAWRNRVRDQYGSVLANWLDIDSLIRAKRAIDHPRHREDLRVLLQVRKMRKSRR